MSTETKRQILLLRHGQTKTNQTNVFQAGDQFENDPLTDLGEDQAQQLAELFERNGFVPDVIVSSAYLRARQTAKIVAQVTRAVIEVPVIVDGQIVTKRVDDESVSQYKSLFREHDESSELEGRGFSDPVARAIKQEVKKHLFDPDWHYSDEENLADIWNRAGLCLEYLLARPEGSMAVVAHGGIFKAMIARIYFADVEGWSLRQKLEAFHAYRSATWWDNTGAVPLLYSDADGWKKIEAINDHLPGSQFGFMPTAAVDSSKEHE